MGPYRPGMTVLEGQREWRGTKIQQGLFLIWLTHALLKDQNCAHMQTNN